MISKFKFVLSHNYGYFVILHGQFSDSLTTGNNFDLGLPGSIKNGIWQLFWFYLVNILFVYVEVLRPCQPNEIMSSAVSLPGHTFTGQAYCAHSFARN